MKNEDNIDDPITLAWFKGWLGGLDKISNSESKIKKCGDYELHDQYITEIGIQYMVNGFQNFLENNSDKIRVTNSSEAQQLILDFLDECDIKYVLDIENPGEKNKFDDLQSYCKDLSSRTIFSLVLDKVRYKQLMIIHFVVLDW